jgi:hypothetical protein
MWFLLAMLLHLHSPQVFVQHHPHRVLVVVCHHETHGHVKTISCVG